MTENLHLYIRSMGKWFQVTALFPDDDQANEWMAKNRDHGVIAVHNGMVFIANLYDGGCKGPDTKTRCKTRKREKHDSTH